MKKILFLAAATAIALSSCSKNEVEVNPTDPTNAIGFSNYIGTSTKAVVTDKNVINKDGESMGVFAEYVSTGADATGASNFMINTEVARTSGTWGYSPLKYWPTNSATIDFCAYYPYDVTSGNTTAGTSTSFPSVKFTQKDTLADMVDFVYATAYDQTSTTVSTTDNKVKFAFKHALSRIAFSARPAAGLATTDASNSTFITVTDVKVTPAANKVKKIGTLTFNKNTASTAYATIEADATAASSTNTHTESAWTLAQSDVNLWEGTASTTLPQSDNTKNYSLSSDDDYIFIIPQTFSATGYMNVEVTYTITTYDNSFGTDGKIEMADNTKTVAMPAMEFAQGTAYNFPLVISPDAIEFGDVTVSSDWTTGTSSDVTVE